MQLCDQSLCRKDFEMEEMFADLWSKRLQEGLYVILLLLWDIEGDNSFASTILKAVNHRKSGSDPKKTEHLLALDGANARLHLFKANLLEEGSFDGAVDGCDGVFHTASPVNIARKNPQSELLDPAVKGTLNVLNSCSKASSVKRVIITASFSSVVHNGKPLTPDVTVDEKWVSSAEFCNESKAWYPLSKTLAEEAAWKFAMDHAIDIIVMNPSLVIGPLLQPTLNTSCEAILNLINGASTFPNMSLGWVDVRDVAEAHILAYETSSANGRYLLAERIAHYSEIVKVIQALFPDIQVTQQCVDSKLVPTFGFSVEKAKSLGVSFIPLEMSIRETIESLNEKGVFIKFGQ